MSPPPLTSLQSPRSRSPGTKSVLSLFFSEKKTSTRSPFHGQKSDYKLYPNFSKVKAESPVKKEETVEAE